MKSSKPILILIFLLFISSCTNRQKKNQPVNRDLNQILKRGRITAITGYNAYSYFIYKGRAMGYDYDLLKQLAEHLNVKLQIIVERDIRKMFNMLNEGKGDLIAFNLTVTKDRAKKVAFTHANHRTRQVLVQRKPKNWRKMKLHNIESKLIRSTLDLEGKTIYVESGSSYISRLKHLSDEIGGDINIVEADPNATTEDLIKMVAYGKINYTVADENVAKLNQSFYTNIDIKTPISFPQKIAWAVRKTSPELLKTINYWLDSIKTTSEYYVVYKKYFNDRRLIRSRINSEFYSYTGGKISQYDDVIKGYAEKLGWDWRLLASLIYQESEFNSNAKSWAGAVGLMQLLPVTAKYFGAVNPLEPHQSLEAGYNYIKWLNKYWSKFIPDKKERIKFILASYNIGFGHIQDARRLAKKYGANPNIWDNNVENYLLKKSDPKYYNDPLVKNGYCSGIETVEYIKEIYNRYSHYKQFIP